MTTTTAPPTALPRNNTLHCSNAAMHSHIEKIFAGEYLPSPAGFFEKCTILDVGANVGAFTFWVTRKMANQHWCNPTVHCYEPMSKNFEELTLNLGAEPGVHLHNVAVGKEDGPRTLYLGKNNPGECSLHKGSEQSEESEQVQVVPASSMPEADILKLDVEGNEVEILQGYIQVAKRRPTWILLEFHGDGRRAKLDKILHTAGYILTKCDVSRPGRGVSFYLHQDAYQGLYKIPLATAFT